LIFQKALIFTHTSKTEIFSPYIPPGVQDKENQGTVSMHEPKNTV